MSQIAVSKLSFTYDGSYDPIFEDVSFCIDSDWKLGFIGRNGRGKTTFLRLLMGELEYSGSINASVDFEYFPYPISDTHCSALEAAESVCPELEYWRLVRELSLLEMSEDVLSHSYETLSAGEKTKLLLSALFMRSCRFLLIDEPTNPLDMHGRRVVANYLNSKKGFILVSHDRIFLDSCVDHILSINKTNIEIQQGNFSSWDVNRKRNDAFELAENDRLSNEISRLGRSVRQTTCWADSAEKAKRGTVSEVSADTGYAGHKAAKVMKRAKAIEQRKVRAKDEKSLLLHNIENAKSLKIHPLPYFTNRLLSCERLSVCYDGKPIFSPISLDLEVGDRVALCGGNGCGKSSLIKLLLGDGIDYAGSFSLGSRLLISYAPQTSEHLSGGLADYAKQRGIDETLFFTTLRKLDFSRIQLENDMSSFSGGQKKKVLIAASLSEQANLYIWDEPLNYIDVFSRMQIEELILKYRPTMLFAEHDRAFVNDIATKKVLMTTPM